MGALGLHDAQTVPDTPFAEHEQCVAVLGREVEVMQGAHGGDGGPGTPRDVVTEELIAEVYGVRAAVTFGDRPHVRYLGTLG